MEQVDTTLATEAQQLPRAGSEKALLWGKHAVRMFAEQPTPRAIEVVNLPGDSTNARA